MRKFTLQQLAAMAKDVADHREWSRESYAVFKAKSKQLDADKAKYAPGYLQQLHAEVKHTAKHNIGFYKEQLQMVIGDALQERELHSRESYLADFRTADEAIDPNDKSKEGKMLRLFADLNHNLRELNLTARITRLSDEDLADRAALAGRMQDFAAAAICLEEARSRKNGLLALQVKSAVEELHVPGLDEAEAFFEEGERVLKEIDALQRLVDDPNNDIAYAVVRSREIADAKRTREEAERKEMEEAAAKRKEEELKQRKTAAEGRCCTNSQNS